MLSIKNLSKKYHSQGQYVLKDVSLEIGSGEFIAILGLSGAGKSTLIRCINLLVKPTSGSIEWMGQDILSYSPKEIRQFRRNIGMIFQSFNLIDRMTVIFNVLVGTFGSRGFLPAVTGFFKAEEIQTAKQLLATVNMNGFEEVKARNLSGGQRQRVAIARALAQEPKLILGDEPVSSLDPATAENVMDLLKNICREKGITMMINLHSIELAKRYASRIVGLSQGNIVFDGPPEKLTDEVLAKVYRKA